MPNDVEIKTTEHDFTLILMGDDELTEAVVDALHVAGCGAAVVGMQSGQPFLAFSRIAPTPRARS